MSDEAKCGCGHAKRHHWNWAGLCGVFNCVCQRYVPDNPAKAPEPDMRPSRVYAREALAAELAEENFAVPAQVAEEMCPARTREGLVCALEMHDDGPHVWRDPAQPVSAPSPEIPDSLLKWWKECDARFSPDEMWVAFKGAVEANVALTKLESALRTAREDREDALEDVKYWRNIAEDSPYPERLKKTIAAVNKLSRQLVAEREARKQAEEVLRAAKDELLVTYDPERVLRLIEACQSKPVSGSPERLEEEGH